MPGTHSKKHTPIVSEKQRKFFGSELGRAKKGEPRQTEMIMKVMRKHLKESAGKKLPENKKKNAKERYANFLKKSKA